MFSIKATVKRFRQYQVFKRLHESNLDGECETEVHADSDRSFSDAYERELTSSSSSFSKRLATLMTLQRQLFEKTTAF